MTGKVFYSQDFASLIDFANKSDNPFDKFVGLGNPSSNILIIGKEEATSDSEEEGNICGGKISRLNASLWLCNYENNTQPPSVKPWKKEDGTYSDFNPLFPFKDDMYFKKGGTSPTWICYQKLLREFIPECRINSGEYINFHQYSFISELSSIPHHSSPKRADLDIHSSISRRCNTIFNHPFFKHFNVIIVACGDYIGKYDTKEKLLLYNTFGIDYIGYTIIEGSRVYVHKKGDRILLQCRQLSNRISDSFIKRLAEIARGQNASDDFSFTI